MTNRSPRLTRYIGLGSVAILAALGMTACSSSGPGSSDAGSTAGSGDGVGVTLIVKTTTNPFFVAMEDGAKEAATSAGVNLTLAAGKEDGDEDTQIQAIENAISKGDKGILITPNGPSVVDAIQKARDAGLFVIALDTAPDPADAVDITFATDNFKAGEAIGEWTAAQLDGKKATIAMLDLFDDKVVSVDYNRDQGFLTGMGIDVADDQTNGDEAKTGSYSGGDYEIVGNEATQGAEDGGRTAMETLLSKNPDVNVVYTINEPAAYGAYQALQAAGKEKDVLLVSIDGGCAGVKNVKEGLIGATAQQYPVKMAQLGVEAIAQLAEDGTKPSTSEGLDFFDTGSQLVTDTPVDGLDSITSDDAAGICWGE
ncbi:MULTISPECIES: substrate-binding domain-containing protein [unclassified Rathayibacter]|jgi:fructose transport system substrate-binding protein|uniref:substrate-binding domain-containing protein n=1 Tax=unclassified Rathayibacter TaxID=2609250 RepID=UPI000CE762FC|nr:MULTISPECIES: substrate-binding domain-containing protein [unclassified Rathayibacter]PPF18694.1 sugar ABC transporter [Rathayibacter sp. AY1A4]PPF39514.1 sugar ABC transporter [Rathayibacter sp. AY1A3]PPG06278.1 sugar ABC transporter [Rathayibacter sp. AY2B1]PPG18003.1 sugar ABC transporter [Rathayibacter sp. AY1C6]PPG31691.1 sugar ABC transporter [Rathayibacter sp. AY2B9]